MVERQRVRAAYRLKGSMEVMTEMCTDAPGCRLPGLERDGDGGFAGSTAVAAAAWRMIGGERAGLRARE
jgi:hypothetical protein